MKTEIEIIKKLLLHTAEKHIFNLQHPEVIKISQQLDFLILAEMKFEPNIHKAI